MSALTLAFPRRALLSACLLGLLLAMAACGRTTEILLSDADNGTAVELGPQQILVITLASNPAAGFGWEVYEVDETVLVPEGLPRFVAAPGTGDSNTAGGTQTFRFVPGGTGRTALVLGYRGPDDPFDILPAQTYTVDVTVAVEDDGTD